MQQARSIQFADYEQVPSVKHRDRLNELCHKLRQSLSIEMICITIYLHNGNHIWLMNRPELAIEYVNRGFEYADPYFNLENYHNKDVLFVDCEPEVNDLQNMTRHIRKQHKSSIPYCLVRRCNDCIITIGVGVPKMPNSYLIFHRETHRQVEQFACHFLDNTIDIFTECLQPLKFSRFASDKRFRDNVLKNPSKRYRAKQLWVSDTCRGKKYT